MYSWCACNDFNFTSTDNCFEFHYYSDICVVVTENVMIQVYEVLEGIKDDNHTMRVIPGAVCFVKYCSVCNNLSFYFKPKPKNQRGYRIFRSPFSWTCMGIYHIRHFKMFPESETKIFGTFCLHTKPILFQSSSPHRKVTFCLIFSSNL